MRSHPVFLRLEGRRCVIIGGDAPAAAKAAACMRAGAAVTVIAAALEPELASLAAKGAVRHVSRAYRSGDLAGAFLVYASTRDPQTIERIAVEAERERALLNVIDVPAASTFISPAVVERGELKLAIGTGGASPALAARLRRELEDRMGPEYVPFVAILGAVRRLLAEDPDRAAERGEVVTRLVTSPLLDLLRRGRRHEIDALLARVAGEDCTLDRLGIALGESR
jgi:siroheme synthase-like protein